MSSENARLSRLTLERRSGQGSFTPALDIDCDNFLTEASRPAHHRTQLIDVARPCHERLVFLKDHDLHLAQGVEVSIAEISLPFAVGALFDLNTKTIAGKKTGCFA